MDDPILALIDRRLQAVVPANVTDEMRLAALVSISAAASNGDAEAKAKLDALRAINPDLYEAVAAHCGGDEPAGAGAWSDD
jgi:hypothetical protein